jgi:hypothetical protein
MKNLSLALLGSVALVAPNSFGQILFSDNFNTDSSASWTVNVAPAANASLQSAQFAFDYSAFGIPAAPGSADTLGLRLRANIPGGAASPVTTRPTGVTSGLSVSPTGYDFGTSYKMTFYAWANFNGSANAQGLADNANSEGGTANVLFAVGTSGTVPLVVGNTALVSGGAMDGIGFATTGDGGIANDYRVYPKSGTISTPASGVYAAGTGATASQNVNPFYTALFPSVGAPTAQLALSTAEYAGDAFNTQAGLTQAGAFGFAWHKVEIIKDGNIVSWFVDDTALATIDAGPLGALGGNNIALGTSDVNGSTTRHPSLVFTLFDNLVISAVPEPSAAALVGVGLTLLARAARRRQN